MILIPETDPLPLAFLPCPNAPAVAPIPLPPPCPTLPRTGAPTRRRPAARWPAAPHPVPPLGTAGAKTLQSVPNLGTPPVPLLGTPPAYPGQTLREARSSTACPRPWPPRALARPAGACTSRPAAPGPCPTGPRSSQTENALSHGIKGSWDPLRVWAEPSLASFLPAPWRLMVRARTGCRPRPRGSNPGVDPGIVTAWLASAKNYQCCAAKWVAIVRPGGIAVTIIGAGAFSITLPGPAALAASAVMSQPPTPQVRCSLVPARRMSGSASPSTPGRRVRVPWLVGSSTGSAPGTRALTGTLLS